jgi:hypothetical protein
VGVGVRGGQEVYRQLTSIKGPGRMGIANMSKRLPFQVREYIFVKNMHPLIICLCCLCSEKRILSVQVKNKPSVGIQIMCLFLVHPSTW